VRFTEHDQETEELYEKLERELGDTIRNALNDERTVEVVVNHDGVIRVERRSVGWQEEGFMGTQKALSFLNTLATIQGTSITRAHPNLSSWIPGYGARIEAFADPVAEGTVLTIRRPSVKVYLLADYVESGRMTPTVAKVLLEAVHKRLNILVVGGTQSGKTTLLMALLNEMLAAEPERRILLLEDTRELRRLSPKWVQLETMPPVFNLEALVIRALRMRPDRIVVGEVRSREALEMLRAMNTGHDGCASTVHANSARLGLLRLEQLIARDTPMPRAEITAALQMVVFISKGTDGPMVRNALRIRGLKACGDYELEEFL
jgi:type IV secretion system protein TrbB